MTDSGRANRIIHSARPRAGKAIGSLLVGDFDAKYDQGQSFDASVVDTHWEGGRMVPILDNHERDRYLAHLSEQFPLLELPGS